MAEFTETQDDLRSARIGARGLPGFLAVVGTIVVIVLIIFFVPKFERTVRPACASAANCRS